MHNRRAIGAEIVPEYVEIAKERIRFAEMGALRIRPMERSVYDPDAPEINVPPKFIYLGSTQLQPQLLDRHKQYTVQEETDENRV
jgi:adenine-specific DNA-methyltransferase